MGGYIMQIQNYSVNDGEGIRTTRGALHAFLLPDVLSGACGAQIRRDRPLGIR